MSDKIDSGSDCGVCARARAGVFVCACVRVRICIQEVIICT